MSERDRRPVPWRRSLMVRLVSSFLILSVVMIAIVGVVAYGRAKSSLQGTVFDRLQASSQLKADALDRWIDEQRRNVVFVAGLLGGPESVEGYAPLNEEVGALLDGRLHGAKAERAKDDIREILTYMVSATADAQEIMVLDTDGEIVVSTVDEHEGLSQASTEYFANGRSNTSVEPVATTELSTTPVITIATPMFSKGRSVAVLAANLNIDRLDRIVLQQTGLGDSGETYLVGGNSRFVHVSLANEYPVPVSSFGIDQSLGKTDGEALYDNYRGEPVVGVYRWSDETGAALLAEMSQDEAFAPARQVALTIFFVGLAVVAFLAVGIYWVSRRVARPILAITDTAMAVQEGDLSRTAPVTTNDEVGTLAVAFNDMTTQLRENVETLEQRVQERTSELTIALESQREAEERYRRLVEELPLAVYTDKPDDTATSIYMSPRIEGMFGYPPEAWMDDAFFASVVHPDDRERVLAETSADEWGEADRTNSEYRVIAADGRVAWVRDEQWIVRDDDGSPLHVQGFLIDVTDQAQAEAEIRRQKQYFEELVQISPAAVVTMDTDDLVTGWNPAATHLFGYAPEEAIGRSIDELVLGSADQLEEGHEVAREALETGESARITQRTRQDGSTVDVEILVVPLIVDGERVGSYAIYHDIGELQEARKQADSANQAKSTFLAAMSHEIRTPMNAIIGMGGLLAETDLDPEQRDYATTIATSGEALLSIINDILDFSKIEAGKMELELAPFDLRGVIESVIDLIGPTAARKGLEVTYGIEPGTPEVAVGDASRLRQILLNLLNNAVKFTDEGEIVVGASASPSEANGATMFSLSVRDTGLGVPADRADRLFRSFSQADVSTSRRYGGTGLGLAISRRLAELMDGTMWVESDGVPGHGSTFHVTFTAQRSDMRPTALHADATLSGLRGLVVDDNVTNRRLLSALLASWSAEVIEAADAASALERFPGGGIAFAVLDLLMPDVDGLDLAEALHRVDPELPIVVASSIGRREVTADPRWERADVAAVVTKPIKASSLRAAVMVSLGMAEERTASDDTGSVLDATLASRHPLRILVAEDNVVNQKLAVRLLEKLGYRADVVANGVETIAALERQSYDLLLSDVQMPEMDGLEATRRIVERWPVGMRPWIVGATAEAMQGDRERCLDAGMDDYLTKPIRPEELVAAIERTPSRSGSASTEAESHSRSIDDDAFRRFVEGVGGDDDPAFVTEMIDGFLTDGQTLLATIGAGIEASDADEVRRAAHTLKSNAATFGATELADLCRQLEDASKAGALDATGDDAMAIRSAFDVVRTSLPAAWRAVTDGPG